MMKKLKNFIISQRFLINLCLLLLIYFLLIFSFRRYLTSYTDHGVKVSVPNLIGKNEQQIDPLLMHLNLRYEISEIVYDPSQPEGTIIGQDPKPSRETDLFVKQGRIIRIKISKKTQLIEVPDCVDKSQRFAEKILSSRGFRYRIEYQPSIEASGAVMRQLYLNRELKEKEKLKIGSTITLVVGQQSVGETLLVPELTDITICEAKNRLYDMPTVQLMVICDNCLTSEDSCSAIIFSQNPEYLEGATFTSGSTITVHASKH